MSFNAWLRKTSRRDRVFRNPAIAMEMPRRAVSFHDTGKIAAKMIRGFRDQVAMRSSQVRTSSALSTPAVAAVGRSGRPTLTALPP